MAKAQNLSALQAGLKPCPFCGGAAKLAPMPQASGWWQVRCRDFHCGGTTWAMQEGDAVSEAWNRRSDEQA